MLLVHLTDLLVAHSPDSAFPPLGWFLVVLSFALGAGLAFAISQMRDLAGKLRALRGRHDALDTEHKALGEKERERAKDLEAKREELAKLKKDMATQRKKTHASQEEAKALRGDLTAHKAVQERQKSERPAFEDEAPRAGEKTAAERPAAREARPEPAPPQAAASSAEASPELEALRSRLAKLEEQSSTHRQEIDAAQLELNKNRAELRGARRKVEDYRRIDAITQGKVGALEDRVANLGRQYYEACTEIAVLKGEVPRVPTPQEREAMRSLETPQHDDEAPGGGDDAAAEGEAKGAARAAGGDTATLSLA